MPAMIRSNKKSEKIVWNILGIPANIKNNKSAFSKKIVEKLNYQQTSRSR